MNQVAFVVPESLRGNVAEWDAQRNRACSLCDHGRGGLLPGTLCPRGRTPVAVETERRPGGSCGPEALHLTFKGLEP